MADDNLVDLVGSACAFLEKEPNHRHGELMDILRYKYLEHQMGAIGLALPACSKEERLMVSGHLGEQALEASTFTENLFSMFFNDILMEAGTAALASLCMAALKSASPETRRGMFSHIEEGRMPVTPQASSELVLMLGDPEEANRLLAADVLLRVCREEEEGGTPFEQLFVDTFYLGNQDAPKLLVERIDEPEKAAAFVYLCFTQSSFGPAKSKDPETPKSLLAALYSSYGASKGGFKQAVADGLNLYCGQRKRLLGLKPNEEAIVRRGLRHFVKSATDMAVQPSEKQKPPSGKRPSKAPSRASRPPHRPHRNRSSRS